jgi:hypothetical protein
MTELEALALLIRNAKSRSRKIDLLTLAEASQYLENLYGSKKELAMKTDIGSETFRVYGLVQRLPFEVKRLVRSRLIDNPEIIESILRASPNNKEKQIELAEAVVSYGLNTQDTRAVEKFVRHNPDVSIGKSISRVLESKGITERRYVLVTELSQAISRQPSGSQIRCDDVLASMKDLGISDIVSCDLHDKTLILIMGEKGFSTLKAKAKAKNASLEEMIDTAILRGLGD